MIKKEKSTWELLKTYINEKPNGHKFTRKELLDYCKINSKRDRFNSVDVCRNLLTRSCYLRPAPKFGEYIKIQEIPQQLSLKEVTDSAYWIEKLMKGSVR